MPIQAIGDSIPMTTHEIFFDSAQTMRDVENESVDLVVTSPPYPMIEMWDEILGSQNAKISSAFEEKDYTQVFEFMHMELDRVWKECYRVLKDGGIACINIGDATRTLDKNFMLYSNHARIISCCLSLGFQNLPNIIWRKQTNAPNKFMGSGMLPPGAYVTLEHEIILNFRKGRKREFKTPEQKLNRYHSSYFWEERNSWFSDLWDLKGTHQTLLGKTSRQRSAAYPFELAYRLVNMFSVQGDTILDPFLGTGTSILAAMASNRCSLGFEIDPALSNTINSSIIQKESFLNSVTEQRFLKHLTFAEERKKLKGANCFKYVNEYYNFPVMTSQETKIKIPYIDNIRPCDNGFQTTYSDEIRLSPPNILALKRAQIPL